MSLLFFGMLMASASFTASQMIGNKYNEEERAKRSKSFKERNPESYARTEAFKKELYQKYADENNEFSMLGGLCASIEAVKFAIDESKRDDN